MLTVGVLLFPRVEELDFVGPFEVLNYINKIRPESTKVMLIAETAEPVEAFNGMKIIPDVTMENCPQLDILVVPGGKGRYAAMKNSTIQKFIQQQAQKAKYITSVCTGAFLLAEAGLLKGKRATTYHTAFAELATYSVEVLAQKVVHENNIITAAGVSSGIELGLYILKEEFGAAVAQEAADNLEYAIDVTKI
ncbi:Isonitrile hydratase [bioreactor metagenome]|uniref:Isonitrile hydratase n=1 Tax=bioreactor metagenome TaxID=1076179 RepID=A0A644XVB3_9ZZZZ